LAEVCVIGRSRVPAPPDRTRAFIAAKLAFPGPVMHP
jgi:hypothetical protein